MLVSSLSYLLRLIICQSPCLIDFLSREAYWEIVLMGTGTLSVCLPSLHALLGSWSLASIVRNTRSFFHFSSSKSSSGGRHRGRAESEGYNDAGHHQEGGSEEHIRVFRSVDVGYAGSGRSLEGGNVPRKTIGQTGYLTSTTETYAMSDTWHAPAS